MPSPMPSILASLVQAVLREWPDLKVDSRKSKSYYYGPNREYTPATLHTVTLYGGSAKTLTLMLLVDAAKNVVSGPDAWLGDRMLVGSPLGTARLQDPRQVLMLVMRAMKDAMPKAPSDKDMDAALARIVMQKAEDFASNKSSVRVNVSPASITVSWWGEWGDEAPGYRGDRVPDERAYREDMAHRTQIHNDFLDQLQRELQRSPYASVVGSVKSEGGVPQDGEFYEFRVVKKPRTASDTGSPPIMPTTAPTASERAALLRYASSHGKAQSMARRVASRYTALKGLGVMKVAGGTDFMNFVQGSDAKKCFREAQEDAAAAHRADWESDYDEDDDWGGEREYEASYTGTIAEKDDFVFRSREPMSRADASKFAERDINHNDKWGPAFAIPVADPSGKRTIGYLFYGIASS